MSYHQLSTKPLNASLKTLLKRGGHIGLGLGAFTPVLALANPTGAAVMTGQASITSPAANGLVIHQSSQSAIINWQQFNIGAGQYVQFLQPSTSSVVLNRVVGGSPTSIFGSLTANGQVFIVNTNGVFFGHGATIDAQGFLASSLDISDSDFLAKHYVFDEAGAGNGKVVNQGSITAHRGGYVVLAGDYSENDGIISAQSGHVILASGAKSTLTLNGNSLVSFVVNSATLSSLAGVDNAGKLDADGGTVIMTADVANALKATVVNNTGLIEARSINKNYGGIYLTAVGGNLVNSGTLDADAMGAGHAGGNVVLKTDGLLDLTAASRISAAGIGAKGGDIQFHAQDAKFGGDFVAGKGGHILIDPAQVTIKTGAGGATNTFGTGQIETGLNSGAGFTISAGTHIGHSGGVTKITATANANGNLSLKVGSGGSIALSGVNITLAGNLSAIGTAEGADMSFGRISAKSVDVTAGSHEVHFAPAAVVNGSLKPSVKASGNISVTAAKIDAGGTGDLNLQAGDDITLHGLVSNAGNITMLASGASIQFDGAVKSGKNITLTATDFTTSGGAALDISAAGNVTLKGAIGSAGAVAHGINANVTLTAGKTIKVDHGIYVADSHSLTITAQNLAYTGTGNLTLSAGYGELILDASIGSAAALAHYGVDLNDGGFGIEIEKSIYTTKGVTALQSGSHFASGPSNTGVFVDGGVTLDASGGISLTGKAVRIGGNAAVSLVADDSNAATHTDTITLHATGSGTGSGVFIAGSYAAAHAASNTVTVDHSVSLSAGQDVDIIGKKVVIGGGGASAEVLTAGKSAVAKNTVAVSAGNDINLSGSHVQVKAGNAYGEVDSDTGLVATATADASVTLKAGRDVNLTATGSASIAGNRASGSINTHVAKQQAKATATADATVTAGRNINATALSVLVAGGDNVESSGAVFASQSSAKATAVAHGDVALSAGNKLTLTADHVQVRGGNRVGGPSVNSGFTTCGGECSIQYTDYRRTEVYAGGKKATASLTATGTASLKAGTGGIALTDIIGGVDVSGGNSAARIIDVSTGTAAGAAATATVKAGVSLATSGAITLKGATVQVRGGEKGGAFALSSATGTLFGGSYHSSHNNIAHVKADQAGSAKLSVDASVSLTATGNITASASVGSLDILEGSDGARSASVSAKHSATAGMTVDQSVTFAGHNIAFKAAGQYLSIGGGGDNAEDATVRGSGGGGAKLSAVSALTIAATGTFTASLTGAGSGGSVHIAPGGAAANSAHALAYGGTALIGADSTVKITSGGAMTISTGARTSIGTHGVHTEIFGSYAADGASAYASGGGSAAITGTGNVTLSAKGALKVLAANGGLSIWTSSENGDGADAKAHGAGATATIDANDQLSLSGTSVTLSAAKDLKIYADKDNLKGASASADSKGVASIIGKSNVTIATGGTFSAKAGGSLSIYGGSHDASEAVADAYHGGSASVAGDASVKITAASIGLQATKSLEIYGGYSYVGAHADASASNGATAAITAKSQVSLAATGAFTATAGSDLSIYGGGKFNGYNASQDAEHHSKASEVTDTSVSIKAGTVALTASHSLFVYGQSQSIGKDASAFASDFGQATLAADGSVKINAATKFSATLAGSGVSHDLEIHDGSHAVYSADASAQHHGVADILADTSVLIAVAAGGITVSTGNQTKAYLSIGGYEYNAKEAAAKSSYGGVAGVTALGSVTLQATGDIAFKNLGASARDLSIYGGYRYNASYASAKASGSGAKAAVAVDTSVNISGHDVLLSTAKWFEIYGGYESNADYSKATADDKGTASIAADASVNINASGTFTAKGSGGSIYGGYEYAAYKAEAKANHGGAASLLSDTSVNITAAGSIKISGATSDIEIYGLYYYNGYSAGASADNGGVAKLTANGSVNFKTGGAFTVSAGADLSIYGGYEENGYEGYADAYHKGAATVLDDASVNITAVGNVTLKANGTGDLSIYGGYESNAKYASASASNLGVATFTNKTNVNITAGGAFTATAGDGLSIYAGYYYNGYSAGAKASYGGVAKFAANGSVNIKAAGGFLASAGNGSLEIYGGYEENGYEGHASANYAGSASALVDASVNVAAGGGITLKAGGTGAVDIYGGYESNAEYAGASANNHGVANFTAKSGVNLTAGGAFTATAAGALYIYAQKYYNGYSASANADNGGVAKLTADGSVNIKVGSTFKASAGGSLSIYGGYSDAGYNANTKADHGGSASQLDNAAVNITAAGAMTLKATGTGEINIFGGYKYAAYSASASADNLGVAAYTNKTNVVLAAGGAFTATAAGSLGIWGQSYYNAEYANAYAYHGGKTNFTADASIKITGTSIALTAGGVGNLSIYGGISYNARGADVSGSSALANMTDRTSVTLTATAGNVTAKAGGDLYVYGLQRYNAYSGSVYGKHGGQGTLLADGSVNIIAAGTVSLTASGSKLSIYGGTDDAFSAYDKASGGGVANFTANAGVNIAAKSGVTVALNGVSSHGSIKVKGGNYAAYSGSVYAYSGAKATLSANSGININAGAGNLSIKVAATHTNGGDLSIYGGSKIGYGFNGSASGGATAAVNALGGVSLTAGGSVTINHATGYVGVYGGEEALYSASMQAAGAGAKATMSGDGSVTIKAGGAVALGAGGAMSIDVDDYTGYNAFGSAASGAVTKVTANDQVSITAGTTFAAKAGGTLKIYGGYGAGSAVSAEAAGAGATAQVSALGNISITAKGAVSLTAGAASTDKLDIYGGSYVGRGASAKGDSAGVAAVNTQGNVSIKAGSTLTATAGGEMTISAGDNAANGADLTDDKGKGTVTANAGVALSAGGGLSLKLSGQNLNIDGGSVGGKNAHVTGSNSGASAVLNVVQSVSLTAGGAFVATGVDNVNMLAGVFAITTSDATVTTSNAGKASATVNSGITIKGSSIAVHHTGTVTNTPQPGLDSNGLVEKGTITISGGHITGFSPLVISPDLGLLSMGLSSVGGMLPLGGGMGSGGVDISVGTGILTGIAGSGAISGAVHVLPAAKSATLSTVIKDGIVVHLQPVTFAPKPQDSVISTDFTSSLGSKGFGESVCAAVLLAQSDHCSIR